jgi:hypothetical protein
MAFSLTRGRNDIKHANLAHARHKKTGDQRSRRPELWRVQLRELADGLNSGESSYGKAKRPELWRVQLQRGGGYGRFRTTRYKPESCLVLNSVGRCLTAVRIETQILNFLSVCS